MAEDSLVICGFFEEAIGSASGLQLEGIREFRNTRAESVDSLLNRVYNFYHFTFAVYPQKEFAHAVDAFADRLSELSKVGRIEHTAENILVLARRT